MVSVSDKQDRPASRRRWPWAAGVAVAVVAAAMAAFVLGRGASTGPRPQAPLQWSSVGSDRVPSAADDGPYHREFGRAWGFAHNERGAVLAALNLSARTSGTAGPDVYEPTLAAQTYGDPHAVLDRIGREQSSAEPGSTTASGYWWRVSSGDPSGDEVVLSIAAKSPQASARGGVVKLVRTLRWQDGDWRLQVPVQPPWLGQSVDGYRWLGGPGHAG